MLRITLTNFMGDVTNEVAPQQKLRASFYTEGVMLPFTTFRGAADGAAIVAQTPPQGRLEISFEEAA